MVTAEDMAILRATLPRVEREEAASRRFYGNLFAIAPEMRPLFRGDLEAQGMRFFTTLARIAALLDDAPALERATAELARVHARAGVRREHFAPLGCALMVTLGEGLGRDFDERTRRAWRMAFEEIAERMSAALDA